MTRLEVIRILKRVKPTCSEDLEDYVALDAAGDGAFREVYHIRGTHIVIKFSMSDNGGYCIRHSRQEIRKIKQVLRQRRLKHLARYVPKVYYMDLKNGVLAMEQINKIGGVGLEECKIIAHLFADTFRSKSPIEFDLSHSNLGYNGRGQIKILDWGCV